VNFDSAVREDIFIAPGSTGNVGATEAGLQDPTLSVSAESDQDFLCSHCESPLLCRHKAKVYFGATRSSGYWALPTWSPRSSLWDCELNSPGYHLFNINRAWLAHRKNLDRSDYPETLVVVPRNYGDPVAVGRAEAVRTYGPGTAANDTVTCFAP
jgi:hypothetical protein